MKILAKRRQAYIFPTKNQEVTLGLSARRRFLHTLWSLVVAEEFWKLWGQWGLPTSRLDAAPPPWSCRCWLGGLHPYRIKRPTGCTPRVRSFTTPLFRGSPRVHFTSACPLNLSRGSTRYTSARTEARHKCIWSGFMRMIPCPTARWIQAHHFSTLFLRRKADLLPFRGSECNGR